MPYTTLHYYYTRNMTISEFAGTAPAAQYCEDHCDRSWPRLGWPGLRVHEPQPPASRGGKQVCIPPSSWLLRIFSASVYSHSYYRWHSIILAKIRASYIVRFTRALSSCPAKRAAAQPIRHHVPYERERGARLHSARASDKSPASCQTLAFTTANSALYATVIRRRATTLLQPATSARADSKPTQRTRD